MPDRFQSMSAAQPGSGQPGADSSSANEHNEPSNTPDDASNTKTTEQESYDAVDEKATVSESNPKKTPLEDDLNSTINRQDAVGQAELASISDGPEKPRSSDPEMRDNTKAEKGGESSSITGGEEASDSSDSTNADKVRTESQRTMSDGASKDAASGTASAASVSASQKDTKALHDGDDQSEKDPKSPPTLTEDDALYTRRPIEPLPSQLKRLRRQDEQAKSEESSLQISADESAEAPMVTDKSTDGHVSNKNTEVLENTSTKSASKQQDGEEDSTRSPVEPTSTQLSRVQDPKSADDKVPTKQVKDTAQLSDADEVTEDTEESEDQRRASDSESVHRDPPPPPGLKLYSDPTPRAAPSGLKKLQPRKSQTADSNQKTSKSDQSEEPLHRSTLTFGMDDDDEELPQRDTAVLSKSNRSLQRQIRAQESNDGTATLGAQREVILVIRGMIERLVISEAKAFTLGRFELGRKQSNEIDLTPYGALDRGVSRVHARLHLQDNHLYVTDLGSTNGTYLAGKRLSPNMPALLRKGDELLIGRLMVQVMFR